MLAPPKNTRKRLVSTSPGARSDRKPLPGTSWLSPVWPAWKPSLHRSSRSTTTSAARCTGVVMYDSVRRRRRRRTRLDLAQMARARSSWWMPQPRPVVLGPARVLYVPDFPRDRPDLKSFYYKEVKGVVTQRFRVIKQLWKIHGPAPLHVIYRKKTEVIYPGT